VLLLTRNHLFLRWCWRKTNLILLKEQLLLLYQVLKLNHLSLKAVWALTRRGLLRIRGTLGWGSSLHLWGLALREPRGWDVSTAWAMRILKLGARNKRQEPAMLCHTYTTLRSYNWMLENWEIWVLFWSSLVAVLSQQIRALVGLKLRDVCIQISNWSCLQMAASKRRVSMLLALIKGILTKLCLYLWMICNLRNH
jgi:hypothetical protein